MSIVSRHSYLLLIVVLLGIAIRIVLSYLSIENLPPSSDESIAQLLAESIAKGEQYPLLFTGQPYQFPIEAYVMSLFVDFFDKDAFAARIPLIMIGIVTLALLCVTCMNSLSAQDRWLTLLLLLIPSAYWLLHQSAYFVPQYTASAFLSALMFFLAIKINQNTRPAMLITIFAGITAGLAISNHLLTFSVVVGAFSIIAFSGGLNRCLLRIMSFAVGFLIGLIPYLLAIMTIEGAYDAISSRTNLEVLFTRLYQVVVSQALPGAMGIYPPYYPDYPVHLSWGIPLRLFFLTGFLLTLGVSIILRVGKVFVDISKGVWPRLAWPDMFIIVSVVSLLLMAINTRSHADDHRYLLPVVWSFPFVIGYLFSQLRPKLHWLAGGYALLLVLINLATTFDLFREWNQPEKIQHHADTADLGEVITWMQSKGISHCYGTFWLAYRFTYETDKKIICAPIYNERFNGWPIPYKKQVDEQKKVAFVMSNTYGTKFSSRKFERELSQYEIQYQREIFGPYFVYYEFKYEPAEGEQALPAALFEVSTNISDVEASDLVDGNVMQAWSVPIMQQPGQTIDIDFKQKQFVQRIDLVHPLQGSSPADAVKIWGQNNNRWIALTDDVEFVVDRLRFENNHPVFGEFLQTIRFTPTWIDAIRIEIVSAREAKPWTLSEVRVGIQTNH